MSYQQILIQGNLTRDAEVRPVGQSQVAKIGVAVSEKYKDRNGQLQESTEFFDVEIWDKPGVYPYLTKGASVLIVGQQKTDRWQDQQSGQNRETKKVRAQVVQLCGSRPQAQQQAPAPQYQQPAPPPAAPGYAQPPMPPQPQYSQPPVPPQPQYPPMNSPQYTGYDPNDLPL